MLHLSHTSSPHLLPTPTKKQKNIKNMAGRAVLHSLRASARWAHHSQVTISKPDKMLHLRHTIPPPPSPKRKEYRNMTGRAVLQQF